MAHLDNPRNAIVVSHFTMCCAASRAHSALAAIAYAEYGNLGPLISGCEQTHFPERIKDELRRLARMVTIESDAAHAARPPRMHTATVRLIGRMVATRDGSGRYGPQPE